jgi:hypothetical protein
MTIAPSAPAASIASRLTGIPPFNATTARFIMSPVAISAAPGTRRFTATTASNST